jgi:diacylglycerol kinase family enzyme
VKLLLVVNPRASEGRALPLLDGAGHLGPEHDCTRLQPQAPEDVEAALACASPPFDAVVLFGGDGTVNQTLPTLIARRVPVAVFPGGSVNDLARELGLRPDWTQLKAVLGTAPAPMDLLAVNGVPFAVYGTLGFGAETSRYMRRTRRRYAALRRRLPLLMAPLFAARTILFTSGYVKRLRLSSAGTGRSLRTPALYVANQSHLNHGSLGWDRARSPGRFFTFAIKDVGRAALLRLVWRLHQAKSLDAIRDQVEVEVTDRLLVESEDGAPIAFFGDGEPLVDAARLEFTVLPGALLVHRASGDGR